MARKTFQFRLYPNRQQRERLAATLDVCRELYNAGLQERMEAWKCRTPVRVFDQINQLPDIKEIRPDVAGVYSQILQDTLRRLDKTYKAFFGRVKRGQKAASREAIATTASPIHKVDSSWAANCNCPKSATSKSSSIETSRAILKP
jgi:transposase